MSGGTLTTPARRRRLGAILVCVGWWGLLAYWFAEALPRDDASPEQAMALLGLAYLAAWGPFFLVSRWSPTGRLARFAACSASIAAAFVLVELPAALNLIDYRAIFHTPTPPWLRPGNAPDPDLLFVREPNRRLRVAFQGADLNGLAGATSTRVYQCDATLDGDGFRNPSNQSEPRVVLIGDSFIEGLQVADAELVSARLAELLGAPVANLGRTGYGPQQELEVLRRHALDRRPRTLVWAFYEGNDLQDIRIYASQRQRAFKSGFDSPGRRRYARSFRRNAALKLLRWRNADPAIPARLRAGLFHDSTGDEVNIYFSCGVHEGAAEGVLGRLESEETKTLQDVFARAYDLCRERGIDLIVAFVPAKFRVYHDLCRFDADSPCPEWPIDELPSAVEKAARGASPEIGFLDLTAAMRSRAAAGELVYLADDTHWSPAGHQAAAAALAGCIGQREASTTAEARSD